MVKISMTSHSLTATCGVFGYTKHEFLLQSLRFFMQHTVVVSEVTNPNHIIIFTTTSALQPIQQSRFWCHVWYKNFGIQNNQKPLSMG